MGRVACPPALLLIAVALVFGCGGDGNSAAAYRDAGPWAVGVTTLSLEDRDVEVWYPAAPRDVRGLDQDSYFIRDFLPSLVDTLLPDDVNPPFVTDAYRDVAVSEDGPFPLVLFAHGFSSFRTQSTFLTTHLASWGFVVASADYKERGLSAVLGSPPANPVDDEVVTRQVVDLMKAEEARSGGRFEARVVADRIAITGHSAGGGTSIRFGDESDVIVYIPLSAGIFNGATELPNTPSLWLTGVIDQTVEVARIEAAYEAAEPPKRLVLIDNAGHLMPSDICEIGDSGGGVIQLAIDGGLGAFITEDLQRLGTDGCQPEALPVRDGWPTVRHFVTAQLRLAFGIDEAPVGLSAEAAMGLPEAMFTYREQLE